MLSFDNGIIPNVFVGALNEASQIFASAFSYNNSNTAIISTIASLLIRRDIAYQEASEGISESGYGMLTVAVQNLKTGQVTNYLIDTDVSAEQFDNAARVFSIFSKAMESFSLEDPKTSIVKSASFDMNSSVKAIVYGS